jgi:hypothetical protein
MVEIGLTSMSEAEKPFPVDAAASRRRPGNDAEQRSLDLVQRMVISALIIVVLGLFAAVLAGYIAVYPVGLGSQGDRVGLWIMSGVVGLVCAGAVLVTNRRRPYSAWVILGLLPMAVSAHWVFTG